MGGCYNPMAEIQREAERVQYEKEAEYKNGIKDFFKTKKTETLIQAAKAYMMAGYSNGFFKELMKYKKIEAGQAPKEFNEFELESKLEIILNPTSKQGREPSPEEVMDSLEFPSTKGALYIKDAINENSKGKNSFFGTADGEEKYVIIQKGGGYYFKEKGITEPYSFGIPGEQIVLKRRETRIKTNPLDLALAITERYCDPNIKFRGTLEKVKCDAFLLNVHTGRMYGMTVSDALIDGRRQIQLETEYAGYIPGFNTDLENERSVVQDIVNINKQVLFLYNGMTVGENYTVHFAPSVERKYDFVLGMKIESIPEAMPLMIGSGKMLETEPNVDRRRRK